MLNLLPGVRAEMCNPEYWAREESILLSADEIQAVNRIILTEESMKRVCLANEEYPSREYRRDFVLYNLSRKEYAAAVPLVSDSVCRGFEHFAGHPQYAVCTCRTELLGLPITGAWETFKPFVLAPVHVGEGMMIYSSTAESDWFYVRSEVYYGWVRADRVAVCSSVSQISEYTVPEDFLVVTANRLTVDYRTPEGKTEAREYALGDRIPLKGTEAGQYFISLPWRDADGRLRSLPSALPCSRQVSRGYLPFHAAALLRLGFDCLGGEYKWGGALGARDCSSFLIELLACFGLRLPRNTARQARIPLRRLELSDYPDREKAARIGAFPPGTLLFLPGHVMIYLGEQDSEHYVLNAAGDFCIKEPPSTLYSYGVSINCLERTYHLSGTSWLHSVNQAMFWSLDA